MKAKNIYVVMYDKSVIKNGKRFIESTVMYGVYTSYKRAVEVCKRLDKEYGKEREDGARFYFYHLIRPLNKGLLD
ncbi:MAG: hypothetical protein IIX02_04340 [Clostridia bacterium]|nr:hypothetical protein [Clostridia bacterium]